jgi:putative ABC transport system permease protein
MRLLLEGLRQGAASLWAHKLRTFLTLLGHIMGVITVITLVSLIQGLDHYVSEKILVQGANLFYVDKFGLVFSQEAFLERMRRPDLTLEEFERVRSTNETLAGAGALVQMRVQARYRDKKLGGVGLIGLTNDAPFLDPYPIADGRELRAEDLQRRRRVAILGAEVKRELFPVGDPIGKKIRAGGRTYEVVGVFGERGDILGQSTDDFIAVPITEMLRWMPDRSSFTLLLQPRVAAGTEEAQEEVRWILRAARGLGPREEDDFEVYSSDALMNLYRTLTGGIFATLVGVGGISLVVGGIVIMNIMLVSVTERTREIGIRKAVGARRRDVLLQFLLESLVLTLAGGLVGVGIGFGVGAIASQLTHIPARITPEAMALGLGVSAVVGLFFGSYPALRASRLDPVTALRYE